MTIIKNILPFAAKRTLTVLILFVFINIIAQPQDYSKINRSNSYSNKDNVESLLDSAKFWLEANPQKAFSYVEDALTKSIETKNLRSEALCYYYLGDINLSLLQYDLSANYFKKALNIYEYLNSEYNINNTYWQLGLVYEAKNNPETALQYYFKYLDYSEKNNSVNNTIDAKYSIVRMYKQLGDDNKALKYLSEIQSTEKGRNNPEGVAEANEEIGDIYLSRDAPAMAIEKYNKSVKSARQAKSKKRVTQSLDKLGTAYRKASKYDEELEVREQSLAIKEELNLEEELADDNISIGEIYIQQNKADKAVEYIQKSIDISTRTGNIEQKGKAYKTLSDAYKRKGDYSSALLAYQEYSNLVDALHEKQAQELTGKLELIATANRELQRLDLLEKDNELNRKAVAVLQKEQDLRDKQIRTQKTVTIILIFVIIALSISSFFVYRSDLQKRKANMLLALKSLRSQMNPHFIFNSLNSVNSFIAQNNERQANKYLSEFSQLMRAVLENSKHDFIPLSDEIAILKLYLKLEHFRFNDKFDYTFDIDEEIDTGSIEIPPMLIQPYIENAVWHGLRYKEEKGMLSVKIEKEKKFLMVVIADNGIGRDKSIELKTKHQKSSKSTGLKNIKNRLDIINELYKTRFYVEISDLDKEQGTGTKVELRIPYTNSEE